MQGAGCEGGSRGWAEVGGKALQTQPELRMAPARKTRSGTDSRSQLLNYTERKNSCIFDTNINSLGPPLWSQRLAVRCWGGPSWGGLWGVLVRGAEGGVPGVGS